MRGQLCVILPADSERGRVARWLGYYGSTGQFLVGDVDPEDVDTTDDVMSDTTDDLASETTDDVVSDTVDDVVSDTIDDVVSDATDDVVSDTVHGSSESVVD